MTAYDQAHDVMERAWQEAQREGRWQSYDDTINGLLDALLAAKQTQACPICWGRVNDIAPGATCKNPDCEAGVVVGTEPLLAQLLVEAGLAVRSVLHGLIDANECDVDVLIPVRRAGSPTDE